VAVCVSVLLLQRDDSATQVTTGPGNPAVLDPAATATSAPSTTQMPSSIVPFPVPGGPMLTASEREAATELVSLFLRRLRAGDTSGAADLWTGYPETMGTAPEAAPAEALAFMQQFRSDAAWLWSEPDPELFATPSAATVTAVPSVSPVVTVVVDDPDGGRRAAAFVLSNSSQGGLKINRLPTDPTSLTPEPGGSIESGDTIVVGTTPVEGGARAFLNGEEVPSSLDLETHTILVTVPDDATGDLVLTVSEATPEFPGAVAGWYRR
jgi:hypothetical protein